MSNVSFPKIKAPIVHPIGSTNRDPTTTKTTPSISDNKRKNDSSSSSSSKKSSLPPKRRRLTESSLTPNERNVISVLDSLQSYTTLLPPSVVQNIVEKSGFATNDKR